MAAEAAARAAAAPAVEWQRDHRLEQRRRGRLEQRRDCGLEQRRRGRLEQRRDLRVRTASAAGGMGDSVRAERERRFKQRGSGGSTSSALAAQVVP